MRTRLVVAIGLVVAFALVVFAIVINGAARSPEGPDAAAGTSGAQEAGAAPSATPSSRPGQRPTASSPPAASESLLEVPQKAQRPPKALPTSVQRRPVFAGKPPKPAHARGKLAAGFPTSAVRLPAKAHVVSSSVAVQGKRVQLALEGRTNASVEQTVDSYAADITAKGWLAATSTAADGTVTVRGGYGNDSIVVSVRQAPTGHTVFSAFGVFAARG